MDFPAGSLVSFAGSGWESRLIALRTCSFHQLLVERRWISHVGVVFHHRGKVMVGESTTWCDYPCEITGKAIRGVQAHTLATRAEAYPGKVWVLPIVNRRRLRPAESLRFTRAVLENVGIPYDRGELPWLATAWLRHMGFRYQNLEALFCSEFARVLYSDFRLLPADNASNCAPAELDREVRWVGLCDKPVRIK